jgi:hypothetical protein
MNKTVSSAFSFVVLALAALTVTGSLWAYSVNNYGATWRSNPDVIVDQRGLSSVTDSDGGVTATIDALLGDKSWNGTYLGTVFSAHSGDVSGYTGTDGVPTLSFEDPDSRCTGSCLASTRRTIVTNGTDTWIRDADIVTNTSYTWTSLDEDPNSSNCSGDFYIDAVMVHEVGHLLGIKHSDVSGATMKSTTSSCKPGPATINYDDARALNDLYGGNNNCKALGGSCSQDSDCCFTFNTCNQIFPGFGTCG